MLRLCRSRPLIIVVGKGKIEIVGGSVVDLKLAVTLKQVGIDFQVLGKYQGSAPDLRASICIFHLAFMS